MNWRRLLFLLAAEALEGLAKACRHTPDADEWLALAARLRQITQVNIDGGGMTGGLRLAVEVQDVPTSLWELGSHWYDTKSTIAELQYRTWAGFDAKNPPRAAIAFMIPLKLVEMQHVAISGELPSWTKPEQIDSLTDLASPVARGKEYESLTPATMTTASADGSYVTEPYKPE